MRHLKGSAREARTTGVPRAAIFLIIAMSLPWIWLDHVPRADAEISSPSKSVQPSTNAPVNQGVEQASFSTATPSDTVRKQNLQEQVRQMAKRLVAERLNEQILQLEENGLTKLPLYGELREMQGHLDELVETHMKEVLLTLEQLVQAPPEKQAILFQLAREKSRTVLVQLLLERQKILRRLRIAEIEERVVRLIERETGVLERTEKTPAENTVQQAASAVAIREDQQDVHTLFKGLQQSLEEIQTWGGTVGGEAGAALQALGESDVDGLFRQSVQKLSESQFTDAAQFERQIIASLEALLERIRRFQGEMESDSREAARRALETLAQRQEELRQQTLNAETDAQQLEPLTQNQLQLQKDIEQTTKKLPQTLEPLEQAARAASQATETLFQGETQKAAEHQQSVVDHLAEAIQSLQTEPDNPEAAQGLPTSEVARSQVADLRQAKAELEKIRQEQNEISRTADEGQVSEAAKAEAGLGQKIKNVPAEKSLPQNVEEAIEKAADTVGQTSQTLAKLAEAQSESGNDTNPTASSPQQQPSTPQQTANENKAAETPSGQSAEVQEQKSGKQPGPADETAAQMAARQAEQAIDEAISAVEMALADAERMRLAAELVEAVQSLRGLETPSEENPMQLARQRAAELQKLTEEQLNQVQSARKAVEAELPLADNPVRQTLEKLNDLASRVAEAAAAQQEAMGRQDRAQEIRAAPDTRKALELAKQAAQDAEKSTTQSPENQDVTAQEKVTAASAEALASLAELPDLPENTMAKRRDVLKSALESAREASQEATKRLATDDGAKSEAVSWQQKSASELAEAAEQIHDLINELAPQVANEFGQHAQTAEKLSDVAVPVHPDATSNLHAAENAAHRVANEAPQRPEITPAGKQGFEHGLTAAAEVLSEREAQLSRALSAAQKLPELLDALKQPPENLANHPSQQETGENTMDPAEMALAAIQGTAQQIATPQPGQTPTSPSAEHMGSTANQVASQPSDTASPQSQGGVARGGNTTQNLTASVQPLRQQTAQANADSRGANQQGQGVSGPSGENTLPPWLLQLPPQMREAIRGGMALPPPKGYEDRLRRYFQNLE